MDELIESYWVKDTDSQLGAEIAAWRFVIKSILNDKHWEDDGV